MLTWHSRTLTRSLLSQGRLASTPKDEPQLGHAALSTLNFTDPPLVFSTLPLPPHSLPPLPWRRAAFCRTLARSRGASDAASLVPHEA